MSNVLEFTGKRVRPMPSAPLSKLATLAGACGDAWDIALGVERKSVHHPAMDLPLAKELDAVAIRLRELATEAKRSNHLRAQWELITYANRIEDISVHIEAEHHVED